MCEKIIQRRDPQKLSITTVTELAKPEAYRNILIDQTMAAYAALVSLMNNIEQIQSHTRLPIHFDQKQSQSLLEKVNFLIDFLECYNYHGTSEEIKNLESRIRDAAYAAEDIIETHVVDTIHAHSRSKQKENEMMTEKEQPFSLYRNFLEVLGYMQPSSSIDATLASSLPIIPNETMKHKDINQVTDEKAMMTVKNPTLSSLEKVVEDLDSIKDAAKKLKDRNETKDMHHTNLIIEPSISSISATKITPVGFDGELNRIMDWLLAHDSSRQVIPIVGMGGIGKTTLAKTAYDKFEGGKHFDFCAWVTISQEYDFKKILLSLLPNESCQMNDDELGQMLHQTLCGRRYLVVLDDMWSVEAWEMVMRYFPDNSNGSRIIVTTRKSSVSTCFGSSIHEMSFLDENQSWSLFCEKVFASNGCPVELEEVGRKIVKNCKGLPLSIVVIGGFLAKSEMSKEYWKYIAQDTKTVINSADDEQCMKILSLSYQNLPVHLKPCFLYLGAFVEDEQISASMLIKLWVAEGFLKPSCSKELYLLGEEYLNDLIGRNLIMGKRRGLNGKIKSCMIHDLFRDICLKEAENEKFMYVRKLCRFYKEQNIGTQRRISFHGHLSFAESLTQAQGTLKSGSMTRTLICDGRHRGLQLQNQRLMRVINTGTDTIPEYSLNDTFQMVNSRLITIRTSADSIIPSSLCLLWNLQILIVKGMKERPIAPLEIWEMTELRHLEFDWDIYLPDPPPSRKINTKEGDTTMKNLHTLKGVEDFRLSDEVVKRIANIKKLKMHYMELEEMGQKSLALLQNLESLNLTIIGSDHLSYLTFPNSLKKLRLDRCGLQWEDMSMIASLPHLEVLKLWYRAVIGPKWVLNEEIFPCLKYLHINYCDGLKQWIAEDIHFPCLEHLDLEGLNKLEKIPSGIGDIPALQKINLRHCSKSAAISAKKILEEQEDLGNVSLQIMVRCRKEDDELKSLASDNFLVYL